MNKKILILLIIAIGVFLRFWRVTSNFQFMMDEERDALIFARVFKTGHIPLIGGSIPGGLYVGPIFTWISAIFLFLFKYDYFKLGLVSAFVASFSLPFLYFSLKKIVNEKVAIISLIIYSFSYLIVEFNKRYWPPTFAPAFFIFILYAISTYDKNRTKSLIIICISLVIGLQSDPSNAAIFIAVVLYFLFIIKEKINAIKIFSVVVLCHIPLFLFEVRHGFFLTHAVLNFFKPHSGKIAEHAFDIGKLLNEIAKTLSRIIYVGSPKDIAVQFPPESALLSIRNNISMIWLVLTFILFVMGIFFLIKESRKEVRFILIFLIVVLAGITFYNYFFPGYTYEWFFTVAMPAIVICFAFALSRVKKEIAIFLLILFSFVNIQSVVFGKNSYGYEKKIELLEWAKSEMGQEPYSLISLGGTYAYSGYRYLADQIGFTPVKSYMDGYFEWLYPESSANSHPKKILVIVNYSEFEKNVFWRKYFLFKNHTVSSKIKYPIEALIVDNSSGWFNSIEYDYFK